MEHFLRSVDSSRGQLLQITVNVWDQIAHTVTLTSHGLKHRDWSACARGRQLKSGHCSRVFIKQSALLL